LIVSPCSRRAVSVWTRRGQALLAWGGEEVTLTAREFSLAEFLIRRKGQVVSRNTIAEHVWDSELDIDSNVIEVYIGYLRRKLDDGRMRGLIETVRGIGYRLMETAEERSDATQTA
jgi:two-component system OmpR family response regulator